MEEKDKTNTAAFSYGSDGGLDETQSEERPKSMGLNAAEGQMGMDGDIEGEEPDLLEFPEDADEARHVDDLEEGLDGDETVPLFANRANRELNKEVKKHEETAEKVTEAVEETSRRVEILKEHLKNVEQELHHTQQLLEAKEAESRTEEHMKELSKRESGRLRLDIEKLAAQEEEVLSEISSVKNDIFKGNEKLEELKLHMNYDQEELEQWTLAVQQQDDDSQAYQKYSKKDEGKLRELTQTIEKLTGERLEKERELAEEVTNTQAKQIELDKTAEEFRELHKERKTLLRQWQESLKTLQRRDESIRKAGEEFDECKKALVETEKVLSVEKQRLDSIIHDNAEVDAQISNANRQLQKQRDELTKGKEEVTSFRSEVELLKSRLLQTSQAVQKERVAVKAAKVNIKEEKSKLSSENDRFHVAREKLAERKADNSSAEERAIAAEKQLVELEQSSKELIKVNEQLKTQQFKESQELFEFQKRKDNFKADISGGHATSTNLTYQLHKLDAQSLHQQELLYTAQFKIQQSERRLSRARGVRSEEEKIILNERIEKCKAELEAARTQNKMLTSQARKLEEETRAGKRENARVETAYAVLTERIGELSLECKSAENLLESCLARKEEKLVNNDQKRLSVKKLRDEVHAKAEELFSLENTKAQLELSMQERRQEVRAHAETQRVKLKIAEEERHKTALESKERSMRVDKLKLKYATVCKNDMVGEGGEERSQAYVVIANAQKNEELQREMDELDASIAQKKSTLKALSAALQDVNQRNSDLRLSFQRVDHKSKEFQRLLRQEREKQAVSDTLFRKRRELKRLERDAAEQQQNS